MPIDRATVDYVALLARLSLTDEERTIFTEQLQHILDYFERLQQLDLGAVEPSAHILTEANPLREDVARPSLPRDEVLAAAPAHEDEFFKVPPILEPL